MVEKAWVWEDDDRSSFQRNMVIDTDYIASEAKMRMKESDESSF